MKIGIDESSLVQHRTGIGSFAHSFLPVLKAAPSGHSFVAYRPGNRELNTPRRLAWEGWGLPREATRDRISILYSPGFSPPPWGRFKKVVTVHDLIGLIYPGNVGPAARFYWTAWLPANVKRADVLVASSESTRRDIVKYLRISESSVQVVPLAASPAYKKTPQDPAKLEILLSGYGIRRPYLLAVGTLEPRKNSLRVAQAFQRMASKAPDVQLVFAGKDAGMGAALKRFVEDNLMQDRIRVLGYVPEDALVMLYNGALGYVMISLYEGFGLPALEAMSTGLSGVVSDVSSLPEVTGDTALKTDPKDVGAIASSLLEFVTQDSRRDRMAEAAHARSRQFSYEKTAIAMLNIFNKI